MKEGRKKGRIEEKKEGREKEGGDERWKKANQSSEEGRKIERKMRRKEGSRGRKKRMKEANAELK